MNNRGQKNSPKSELRRFYIFGRRFNNSVSSSVTCQSVRESVFVRSDPECGGCGDCVLTSLFSTFYINLALTKIFCC